MLRLGTRGPDVPGSPRAPRRVAALLCNPLLGARAGGVRGLRARRARFARRVRALQAPVPAHAACAAASSTKKTSARAGVTTEALALL